MSRGITYLPYLLHHPKQNVVGLTAESSLSFIAGHLELGQVEKSLA